MITGWLSTAGPYKVEHLNVPHPRARVDMSKPPTGVLHTIEGSLESGLSVFRTHYAPTFVVGQDKGGKIRIIQCVPLGMMAAALENDAGGPETNRWARVQIELAGRSSTSPWLPTLPVQEALAALMGTLVRAAEIPLFRPFPDRMPPTPWAVEWFSRRREGKWGKVAGWYGHVEVPENAHWDPGALKWGTILDRAEKYAGRKPQARRRLTVKDKYLWLRWRLGHGEFKEAGPANPACRPDLPAKVPDAWWQALRGRR